MCPTGYGLRVAAGIKKSQIGNPEEVAMRLTIKEAREWFQIRDHVKEAVAQLEVCERCWRVRDLEHLVLVDGVYCCRPGDAGGCLAARASTRPQASWPWRPAMPHQRSF